MLIPTEPGHLLTIRDNQTTLLGWFGYDGEYHVEGSPYEVARALKQYYRTTLDRHATQLPSGQADPRRYATWRMRVFILNRDEFKCRYCRARVTMKTANIDHVIPWVRGGRTVKKNLVTACQACNEHKLNKHIEPLPLRGEPLEGA